MPLPTPAKASTSASYQAGSVNPNGSRHSGAQGHDAHLVEGQRLGRFGQRSCGGSRSRRSRSRPRWRARKTRRNSACRHRGWVITRTPTNPRISADQRWTPTLSFRITIDSRVVNSGAEKPIAIAEPSDSILNATNHADHRAELRQPALQMLAIAARAQHRQPGARQDHRRDRQKREQRAEKRDLADRVGLQLPFDDRVDRRRTSRSRRPYRRCRAGSGCAAPSAPAPSVSAPEARRCSSLMNPRSRKITR